MRGVRGQQLHPRLRGDRHLTYDKKQPGAVLAFGLAAADRCERGAFDLRISIGDTPVIESYYLTLHDESELDRPLREVIERHAIDPAVESRLDGYDLAELPFLRRELEEIWRAHTDGQAELAVYANGDPRGPADLDRPAREYLGTCLFDDGVESFRQLDLVWELAPPRTIPPGEALRHAALDGPFLLMWLGWLSDSHGVDGVDDPPAPVEALDALRADGLLDDDRVALTHAGLEAARALYAEAGKAERFNRYRSVSLDPPALGVPRGFDLRVQMFAHAGIDPLRALTLIHIRANARALFTDGWTTLAARTHLDRPRRMLAWRTGFTEDVLERVARVGL